MRKGIGITLGLALAACGKPAPQPTATPQAPQAPQVRIAQVGGTVIVPTVAGSGTVAPRGAEAMPGVGGGQVRQSYILKLPLSAADAARLTLGANAQVTFAAFNGDTVVGRVIAIGTAADDKVPVELSLPNDARLAAGQTGTARIVANGAATRALAVPPSAVIGPHVGAASVFVVDLATSRLHARAVMLGDETPAGIAVTKGLTLGEWVALTRVDQLKDGMKIAPVGPE